MYEELKKAIETLRDVYLKSGTVHSYQEINRGYCPEFADEIIYDYLKGQKDIEIITTDYLREDDCADDIIWDVNILKNKYHACLPKEISWKEVNKVSIGYHVWIYYKGKHFDAECPDGVDNLFNLPFFKRDLNSYIKEKTEIYKLRKTIKK